MAKHRFPAVALFDARTLERSVGLDQYARAAERAFRLYGSDAVRVPAPLYLPGSAGGVHVKAAALHNPSRNGRPTIQGLIAVFDAEHGTPLALLDSASVTAHRTAAACALAARTLARSDATDAAVVGCGAQAPFLLRHLCAALPRLARVSLYDSDRARALALRRRFHNRLGVELSVARDLSIATRDAAIIVTCTPARTPFLSRAHAVSGCFVAALGADHPDKRELHDDLLAAATLIVDSRSQCRAMGEWHHVTELAPQAEPAELGEVLRGERKGRQSEAEIIVFDSTGMAAQDACAVEALLGAGARARHFRFA